MLSTGKGDDGTTTLCDTPRGKRIEKCARRIEALGSLDELNSYVGLCKAKVADDGLKEVLHKIQEDLFIVQAEVAGAGKSLTKKHVDTLEEVTDEIETKLEPVTSFVISGATELTSLLDIARAVARRAERRVVEAIYYKELKVSKHTLAYLNRLSATLYTAARLTSQQKKVVERSPGYK